MLSAIGTPDHTQNDSALASEYQRQIQDLEYELEKVRLDNKVLQDDNQRLYREIDQKCQDA